MENLLHTRRHSKSLVVLAQPWPNSFSLPPEAETPKGQKRKRDPEDEDDDEDDEDDD